jgi:hypothetical protein
MGGGLGGGMAEREGKGGVRGCEAYEAKNKREKLRCLLLRRKKKNIYLLFMMLMGKNSDGKKF